MKVKFDANDYTFEEVNDLSIAEINKAFRAVDESHKFPVCGKFNVTERAIRNLRKLRAMGMEIEGGWDYCQLLEMFMSNIVNRYGDKIRHYEN